MCCRDSCEVRGLRQAATSAHADDGTSRTRVLSRRDTANGARPWPSCSFALTTRMTGLGMPRRQHQSRWDLLLVLIRLGTVGARICRGQPPTAPDRMNAKTRGKMWQNSPPPHESTSPPARSIASHKGSADRTKSCAVAASTSSTAHTAATISRRVSAGRSASEPLSTVTRYARPAASVLI
jgi:hypothetical protein